MIGLILCVDACPARHLLMLNYVLIVFWTPWHVFAKVESSHQAFLRWMGYFDDDDDDERTLTSNEFLNR